jgi:hypothetical protein
MDEKRHANMQQLQQRSVELQENILAGFRRLTQGIKALVQAQAEAENRRRYEESERRRKDGEQRAAESEPQASLLQALAGSHNNWYICFNSIRFSV